MKAITILGSTGSIGVNALRVVRAHPQKYKVVALGAGRNIELLGKQIREFQPVAVAVQHKELAEELTRQLDETHAPEVFYGTNGYVTLATLRETDVLLSAMTGAAGLVPTFRAIQAHKNIALANKETMVMAGGLVMKEAERRGVAVLPVDSEHSAIFQCLKGHHREDLRRVILTASGGPFRDAPEERMEAVTPAQALAHPNWSMGRKITIDSATLMNKGLELIEAKWLFDLRMDQISILVHPQSIVHSMVEYNDGSVIAQMGTPDMTIPISYALAHPRHLEVDIPRLELEHVGVLSFETPDVEKFRCLGLAMAAAETGESMPTVLNAANEVAVESFLRGEIGFLDIAGIIEECMGIHHVRSAESIDSILEVDSWARSTAQRLIQRSTS